MVRPISTPPPSIAQKIQLRFSKRGALRFLSHHDVIRLFSRALKRAGLPIRMTQGFDPRPRLVFATALELGIESLAEEVEIELTRWTPPDEVSRKLTAQLPAGIRVLEVALLAPRRGGPHPAEITYRVTAPPESGEAPFDPAAVARLMASPQLVFERPREKHVQRVDLRPSLASIDIQGTEAVIQLRPAATGSARPAEVMSMLTGKPLAEIKRWRTIKTSMRMSQ